MYDKDFIERVSNLTCSVDDIFRGLATINYDYKYPFNKYYNVNSIIGALKKYANKEWNKKVLCRWAEQYKFILMGGLHKKRVENFTEIEKFLFEVIIHNIALIGCSNIPDLCRFLKLFVKKYSKEINNWINIFVNIDYVWQTRNDWRIIKEGEYFLLTNDNKKEYIIIHCYNLDDNIVYEEKIIKDYENNLKKLGYILLNCNESFYYSNINTENHQGDISIYDKEIIEKVCNLTFKDEDIPCCQTDIKYDHDAPFYKYYNVNSIIGALNKYLSDEWNAKKLAKWACLYNWIILGGFHDDVIEYFDPLEQFIVNYLSDHLDGLSFFDSAETSDEDILFIYKSKKNFINYDYVLKTKDSWEIYYSKISSYYNKNLPYVLLVNEKQKKYMILNGDSLDDEDNDEYFTYIPQNKFVSLEKDLKSKGYTLLNCAEETYYDNLD